MQQNARCAEEGGCPTDYIAISFAALFFILLLSKFILPFVVHKVPNIKGSGFWIPVIQIFASFNLLLSLVMSVEFLTFKRRHWWQSCYVWAGSSLLLLSLLAHFKFPCLFLLFLICFHSKLIYLLLSAWVEGPLGFGLLLSCRIAQAFQLYNIFVRRRLPPIRSYIFLPLLVLPWVGGAGFIHMKQPLNNRCHMGFPWIIPIMCLHALYVATLAGFWVAIRHIEFRFDELKDLLKGTVVSASSIGVWAFAYILNEIHDEISWLQAASRFLLLVTASVLVLVFFSISSSEPLLSQISLRKREPIEFETMGQALGIPDSGLLSQRESTPVIDPNEPLDKLLLDKRFRQSFMEFADSCLAGESVHFYDEVHEHEKIPVDDHVRRIYMARHIIEKYIVAGASMEVNISHRTRQEILTTPDLAHPDLFNNAINELIQLLKMNLAKDYWSSMFFIKFKEDSVRSTNHDLEHMADWNFSPRLSSIHCFDDPFHQEQFSKGSSQ
ncbi:hypothetical protein Dsin_010561 [Dipteronia sinensis]|uniref:RGS domain-containing protein n=1 Tax=Dipteronia sinensis TaxID=43782 RepID=A0AAE0ECS6_9ROSI|nr:hypothetical protein Dsin_010561 [Dipteronia sinensis]